MDPQGYNQDWIVLTFRFNRADDEAIASLVAECVDLGAVGGAEAPHSQPFGEQADRHAPRSDREVEVRLYFPGAGPFDLEEVAALVEARAEAIGRATGIRTFLVNSERARQEAWSGAWRGFFPPIQATEHFWVVPPWDRPPLPKGSTEIILRPGPAFGTGRHATTRHCLSFIEALARKKSGPPRSFLDVGCGSGILAIAARLSGATRVVGLDIDRDALGSTRENLALNNLSMRVLLVQGSVACVRERFELIAANLDARTLQRLRMPIRDTLAPGGFLILSGILDEEKPGVRKAYEAVDLICQAEDKDTEEGWTSLLLVDPSGA